MSIEQRPGQSLYDFWNEHVAGLNDAQQDSARRMLLHNLLLVLELHNTGDELRAEAARCVANALEYGGAVDSAETSDSVTTV